MASEFTRRRIIRSEEHTSELQSHDNLVCRLLLETKNRCENRTRRNRCASPRREETKLNREGGDDRIRDRGPQGAPRQSIFLSDGGPPEVYAFPPQGLFRS